MVQKNNRKRTVIVCILALLIAGLSCKIPLTSDTPVPATKNPVVVPSTQPPAPPATNQVPTAAAPAPSVTPTEQKTSKPAGEQFSDKGLSFSYDKQLAQGVSAETLPAVTNTNDAPPWELTSQYDHFKFNGYILQKTFHDPQIFIYPTVEMAAANDGAKVEIDNLKKMLAGKPGGPFKDIPFIPAWNAAQMIRSQVSYLDFQNGSGIRFLSQYGQGLNKINNHELFYTFQGLTADGKYYISVLLPVSHPSLPATGDVPQDEYQKFADTYAAYISGVEKDLGSQDPSSFKPDLSVLDALVKSIQIKK